MFDPVKLLRDERRKNGWTVKELAFRIGLDRSDFYRAAKRQLPSASAKQKRFDKYLAQLASKGAIFVDGITVDLILGDVEVG